MIHSTMFDTATMNRFSFDLTTSSGDRISLSMYDNRSLSLSTESDGRSERFSMSLRHEYGYSFSYRGDGIDAQDAKEIEEAMEKIGPLFETFLEGVAEAGKMPARGEIVNLADDMRRTFPRIDTASGIDALKSRTVETMDGILSLFERDRNLLESSKRLFDTIFGAMDRFEIYV